MRSGERIILSKIRAKKRWEEFDIVDTYITEKKMDERRESLRGFFIKEKVESIINKK